MTEYKTNVYDNSMSFRTYLEKVFSIMIIGLAITSVLAIGVDYFLPTIYATLGSSFAIFVLVCVVVELVVAIYFSKRLMKMSKATAWTCYILYAVLTGISIGTIIANYTGGSVALAFISATVLFACMAIIGHTTHLDLTKYTTLLIAGLIALFVTSLLNAFLFKSAWINYVISVVGVVLFLILVAHDMQKLKRYYELGISDQEINDKLMIMGAFQLYLDFINIFLRILELFGKSSSRSSK